jgi:hypothetical protein
MRNSSRLLLLSAVPATLCAQAWLSPKGQGTVTTLYQYGFDRYHALSQGERVDRGHIALHTVMADVDYSLTDRLAVRVALPFIQGRYSGLDAHRLDRSRPETAVKLDDGHYHGSFQDFRIDVRYNASRKHLMITPFFQVNVPSHGYPTLGHTAVGTAQREYRTGVNVGRRLDPILPNAYVQGRFAFGVVQRVAGISPKRSYGEFQFGYFLTRRLSVQGAGVWTHSHNGIDFIFGRFPDNLSDQHWVNHDRITNTRQLDLGGAANYSIDRSTTFFVGVGHSVYGANAHLRAAVVTVGITKSFSVSPREEKLSATAQTQPAKALVCTCAKSR